MRIALFACGAGANAAWVRFTPLLNHRSSYSMNFSGYTITVGCVAVAGGLFVMCLFMPLIRRQAQARAAPRRTLILSAAGRGVVATALALEVYFLAASALMAFSFHPHVHVHVSLFAEDFFGAWIGVQTYGMEAIIASVPFAAAYGAAGGLLIGLLLRRRQRPASG